MRLLVLNYEYPPLGGGAANATLNLCREWGSTGHDVDVITTWHKGLPRQSENGPRVKIYRVASPRRRLAQSNPFEMLCYVLWALPQALRLIRRRRHDLVISFFGIPSGLVALPLHFLKGVPYIVLLRGGDVPGFLNKRLGLYHTMTKPVILAVWKSAGALVANSQGLAHLAERTANRIDRKVVSIPNGVDTTFFAPSNTPRNDSVFRFLFVGRYYFQKNLLLLIQQFERYARNAPLPTELVLVGDGPEYGKLQRAIAAVSSPAVRMSMHEWQPKEGLVNYYHQASCFVNPSLEEGLPNAVLEAMACGLPIIASDVAGNNELVENGVNGFLFSLDTPDMLGKCMEKIATESDAMDMGQRARQKVISEFSWQAGSRKILELFILRGEH